MSRAQRPGAKSVDVRYVTGRLYARDDRGGTIYRGVRLGGGAKDRASLGTTDRAHAERLARALAG